jgi:hypothetical protein
MKKLLRLLPVTVVAAVLTACASTESAAAAGAKAYPLKVCIVTDNDLGSMGTPVTLVHDGQAVKFCCKPCVKKFNAEPQKYLAKLK